MNNKNHPARYPQSRVTLLGCPIHGLVKGGQITLPNGATRAYTQPPGSYDMAGATYSVERPGVPAVALTPEQTAEAAANGWQWRNRAMLSGEQMQLYGQVLGGWIYVDSAGDRWIVETSLEGASTDFVTGMSGVVTLRRFGDFGRAAESHTYSVSLADVGQSSAQPDPLKMYDVFFNLVEIGSASINLHALSPDGARAALMINTTARYLPTIYGNDLHYRYALGWLELSISGLGGSASVALSVLRTRTQTLQASVTATSNITTAFEIETFDYGSSLYLQQGRYIMGMHWTGAWSEVALEIDSEQTVDAPYPSVSGGTASRVTAEESSHTVRIVGPGGAVQIVASGSGGVTQTAVYETGERSMIGGHSSVFDGAEIEETITWSDVSSNLSSDFKFQASNVGVPALNFLSGSANPQTDLLNAIQFFLRVTVTSDTDPVDKYIDIVRYSAQVYGLRYSYQRGADGATSATFTAALTPSGVSGGAVQIPHAQSARYYGSWCPHTGQAVWLELDPVCWV